MTSALAHPTTGPAHHRAIVAVDIEGSSKRTNPAKARVRATMYDLVEQALDDAGITDDRRDPLIDCGDGVLALIHPVAEAPKALLLNRVIPTMRALLDDHGLMVPDEPLRLRAVVHAGEVHHDRRGCFGEALDITFRLLNAPQFKARLNDSTAPLVVVVSDDIYRAVVRHGYEGIDPSGFTPNVRVRVAGEEHHGWVHVPAARACRTDLPRQHRRGLVALRGAE
ncbi:hypothetical protein [Saccharothrix stipae]